MDHSPGTTPVERCDLCIVGAGVAGLNALFAASQYLTPEQRVVLVEEKPAVGGMWNETYDYVRLHQPHPMFTAGSIPWTLEREPWHLASKEEVLTHFRRCLDVLRTRVDLVARFGTRYREHREIQAGSGCEVEVVCEPVAGGAPLRIRADRFIKAPGFDIPQSAPLPLSSSAVRSISPHSGELAGDEIRESDAPVYVVGGGKTGMDTAHEVIRRCPGRRVFLIDGSGTIFLNRNKGFPKGWKRWWAGVTGLTANLDVLLRFTGDNEAEVFDYFRKHYALALRDDAAGYVLGVLSVEERDAIASGVEEIFPEYLSDVVDRDGAPNLLFRSGRSRAIEAGSWIVNCTGHLFRQARPYEPFLSPGGAVVSVQPTSGIHVLSTVDAYFLTHLFYLGKLDSLPLYELNYQELARQNKRVFAFGSLAQSFYNLILILDAVPSSVMRDFGLDFDRWYPNLRRLPGLMRLRRNKVRYAATLRAALDRLHQKYGVTCGVLARREAA